MIAAIAAAATSFANATDATSAASIRERIARADGVVPRASRVGVAFTTHDGAGVETTFRFGDDMRTVTNEGPFTTQYGHLGAIDWHQNANNQVVIDRGDPGKATAESYVESVEAVTSPVAGYRLARLSSAGYGTVEFVDGRTWRIVRRDEIGATETRTTTYDDFRSTHGYTRPWHWTVRDGHPENDADFRVTDDVDVAAAGDVAIPAPRASFLTFPVGKTRVVLPARLVGNEFYIRLTIAGRGMDFILDSGASGITIDADAVRKLGLATYNVRSNATMAGRHRTGQVLVPDLAAGEIAMHRVAMSVTPRIDDRSTAARGVGLLGFDFIAALALDVDYEHGRVTAIAPNSFVSPTGANVVALDVRLSDQIPFTDVAINGAIGERFLIDTGARETLLVFDRFRRTRETVLVDRGARTYADEKFDGVGGSFDARPIRLASVRLASVNFTDFYGYVVRDAKRYAFGDDGLIGAGILELYDVVFDYENSRIYLAPNDVGRAAAVRKKPSASEPGEAGSRSIMVDRSYRSPMPRIRRTLSP